MVKIIKYENLDIQKVNNEIIIYSPDNDLVVCLNETGTMLWDLLDTYCYLNDIINKYYLMFDDKPSMEQFQSDVDDVLSDFVRAGLIQFYDEMQSEDVK